MQTVTATHPTALPPGKDKPDRLERFGLTFLKKRRSTRADAGVAGARTRILTTDQQIELKRVQSRTIMRGALAGLLSGIIAGFGENLAAAVTGYVQDAENSGGTTIGFWTIVGVVAIASSVGEILFLYWDSLRSVHRLTEVAHIELFADGAAEEQNVVASALTRAALELPNPKSPVFGIDPLKEASKMRLIVVGLLYRAKRGVTNFILKAVIRRIGARAAVKGGSASGMSLLPFVAAPVFAAWNAYVCWKVMREARLRVVGPSAARELIDAAFAGKPDLSPAGKLATLRALGATIVRQESLHPNLMALLGEVMRRVGEPGPETIDDRATFMRELPALDGTEQSVVLDVLRAAVIMDGDLSRSERDLLVAAHAACGRTADIAATKDLLRRFIAGERLIAGPPSES